MDEAANDLLITPNRFELCCFNGRFDDLFIDFVKINHACGSVWLLAEWH